MSGTIIFDGASPKTQSIDAVKGLLVWRGRESASLPSFIEVGNGEGRVVLVLSNKKDCFYVVTPKACSCPSQTYRGGPCKHMRAYFPQFEKPAAAALDGSIRPTGSFKPFSLLPSEEKEKAAKASPSMLIDLHDTTAREAAYWSIKEDRILWPVEA